MLGCEKQTLVRKYIYFLVIVLNVNVIFLLLYILLRSYLVKLLGIHCCLTLENHGLILLAFERFFVCPIEFITMVSL